MVEGTPLLREHARKNVHRRFESVRLRHYSLFPILWSMPEMGAKVMVAIHVICAVGGPTITLAGSEERRLKL